MPGVFVESQGGQQAGAQVEGEGWEGLSEGVRVERGRSWRALWAPMRTWALTLSKMGAMAKF